jgi:choline dehydrogenase-like flavoprotein
VASARSNTLEADVCIAGAGPAGLTLASALADSGLRVVVVESGEGSRPDPDPLDDGDVTGEGFAGLSESRRRGLGGTALSWNSNLDGAVAARYIALDPIDFEARAWVPHSGWPITAAQLAPWYDRAGGAAGLGATPAREEYRVGLASVFTADLPRALAARPNVQVRTDATVTRVRLDRGERVEALECAGRDGSRAEVRAATFVLALGAVENARALLLAGIGGDWTGRGFMEHPRDRTLRLVEPTRSLARREEFYEVTRAGASWGRWGRIAVDEADLRRHRILNASATMYPSWDHRIRMRGPFRRLLGKPRSGVFVVTINLEQAPDRDNRITLSTRTDAFGTPFPRLAWRWNPVDEASRVRVRELIRSRLERERFGRIEQREQPVPDPNAHHHAGTTRMAATPGQGVVDEHCRVFGTENLYVAGASVFPTAGFANPTLTILALALRLAAHLTGEKP